MIITIVPCLDETAKRAVQILHSTGNDVIAIGNPEFFPILSVDKVQSEYQTRWEIWNHGIDIAIGMGYDKVVLIGDHCIPQNGLPAAHEQALSANAPLITVGRCLDPDSGWRDRREHLFVREGSLVNNVSMISNGMVACGNMGINLGAIQRMKTLNAKIAGKESTFIGPYGHRIGYAAWLMHVCMWILPFGCNGVKISSGYQYDSPVESSDPYIAKMRETNVSLDML